MRTAADLSQEELAARSDVDVTYISLLERGRRQPTLSVIKAIAEALGRPAFELVRAAEEMPPVG